MTHTKATPGPWRYQRSGYGSKNADFDIVNEAGGRIASTPYADKARLIAAAPDLLAACKMIAANHARAGGAISEAQLDWVRAALARATGAV